MTTIVIPGFSSTDKVPGFYGQTLTGQGPISAQSVPLVLLDIGISGAAGTAVQNTQVYPITSVNDADSYFVAGSQLARQCYASLKTQGAILFGLGIPSAGGAVAATAVISISGSWTTIGSFGYRINGEARSVTVASTDTPSTVATAVINDINSQVRWPVTATSAQLGTTGNWHITLTDKTAGIGGNQRVLFIDTTQVPSGFVGSLIADSMGGLTTAPQWSNNGGAGTAYTTDSLVQGTSAANITYLFKATTGGTGSTTTAPVWPASGTVSDGTVVWTNEGALLSTTASQQWQLTTSYPTGSIVLPTTSTGSWYRVTTGGISGATIPTQPWTTVVGTTITDNTVTLTCEGPILTGNAITFTLGAGTESYTTALSTIVNTPFDRIAPGANDATNLAAIKTQLDSQAGPITNILGQMITATNGSLAAAESLASTTLNDVRCQLVWYLNCETHPCEIAASFAAVREVSEGSNWASFYDNVVVPGVAPQAQMADWPNHSTLAGALNNGVTPMTTVNGTAIIVRSIQTHCITGSYADYSTLDTTDITVPDQIRFDLRLYWTSYFKPNNPVCADNPPTSAAGAIGQFPPSGVAMPMTWNAQVYLKLKSYERGDNFPYPQIVNVDLNKPVSAFDYTRRAIMSYVPVVPIAGDHQIGVSVAGQVLVRPQV